MDSKVGLRNGIFYICLYHCPSACSWSVSVSQTSCVAASLPENLAYAYLPVNLSVCLSVYLFYLSDYLCLPACLFICLTISACLPDYLSDYLCLSACLSV
jgi:hypothetical protein